MVDRMTRRQFIAGSAAAALDIGYLRACRAQAPRNERRRAMFSSIIEAREALAATFGARHADMLTAVLQPTIAFHPAPGEPLPAPGATRIGGTPGLPEDIKWPVRAVPGNLDEIAARGGANHRESIARHLRRALPFEFLAQVDLAEAARLGPVAALLPPRGRLLFFYDAGAGPWHTGSDLCRVIWDQTPDSELARQQVPQALLDLAEEHEAEAKEEARKNGWPYEDLAPRYWGPPQPMRLAQEFRLPHYSSIEVQSDARLLEALDADQSGERYRAHFEMFWSKGKRAARHQLLGSPLPEQSDPRYDAVIVTEHGVQHLPRETWKSDRARLERLTNDWCLLLQIDNQDYLQQRFAEGTIYFLVRRSDPAERAFERVVAIYQQT
jgi:uncharacterized protein YwqG